jgi:glutaconate CoA-transferase subunit A
VERLVPGNMLEDERLAPGCISATYVEAVAVAARGSWPSGLLDEHAADGAHYAEYARMAKTEAGFREYCDRYVFTAQAQAAE